MNIRLEQYDFLYAHSFSSYVNPGLQSALLEFFISADGVAGSEMFSVEINNPQCLERELREVNDVKVGRHQFVVREIDEDRIVRFIRGIVHWLAPRDGGQISGPLAPGDGPISVIAVFNERDTPPSSMYRALPETALDAAS